MLHIPTVASLLIDFPSTHKALWEENLTLLFPYRKQWIKAFLQCLEIDQFLDKVQTADFNLLQEWTQVLTQAGLPYNLAMPSLTTWRGALQLNKEETFSTTELLKNLQKGSWDEIQKMEQIPAIYHLWASFQKQDFQSAVPNAHEILTNAPQDEVVLYIIGNAYFYLGEYVWATTFLERAVHFGMNEAKDVGTLIEQAHQELEEKAQELPLTYWQEWAEKLISVKEWQTLEKISNLIETQIPAFPKADLMYYRALCAEQDTKKSLQLFTKAIELTPKHYFYTQRGEVYLKLNKKKEAIADFRMAISLNEEDDKARQYLESLGKK